MKNEIIRVYENKKIIIYKRVGRDSKNIPLYFVEGKTDERYYSEMRDIRGVKAFIKSFNNQ